LEVKIAIGIDQSSRNSSWK